MRGFARDPLGIPPTFGRYSQRITEPGVGEVAAVGVMTAWVTPVPASTFARLVVVSPHFDDAVLGCGRLLARHAPASVVTVMGGAKLTGYADVTSWDALGGFTAGVDVVATRRAEDGAAMDVLGCTSSWLDFSDHQYDEPTPGAARPPVADVAAALEAALDALAPTAVVIPFGLANPDHVLTHDAALAVVARRPDAWAWFGYAEAGYAHIPGAVAWRTARLVRAGIWPTPAPVPADGHLAAKRAALRCYASQLPALAEDWGFDVTASTEVGENYWRLEAPPPGWGELAP